MENESLKIVEMFMSGDFNMIDLYRISRENKDPEIQKILLDYGSMIVEVGLLKNPHLDLEIRLVLEERITLKVDIDEE